MCDMIVILLCIAHGPKVNTSSNSRLNNPFNNSGKLYRFLQNKLVHTRELFKLLFIC